MGRPFRRSTCGRAWRFARGGCSSADGERGSEWSRTCSAHFGHRLVLIGLRPAPYSAQPVRRPMGPLDRRGGGPAMMSQLRPAVVSLVFFTLLTGLAYPLAMTGD